MATSGATTFNLSIDEIIEESYERIGIRSNSGYDIKSARRSLNILFSEWGNRGVHLWKVKLYDQTFEWSDSKMYCSELVWKIYDRALGIKIGETQSLRDFDLNNKIVYHLLKKRYPGKIPYDETVISPSAIFDSGLLITVAER